MKYTYPPEYHKFRCIADSCPDSCCTDWEIVLDAESENRYRQQNGNLGKRLHEAMITDEDGDVIFKGNSPRCPFWNDKHLCDIQTELGEAALCETCRMFPRITQDYGDFVEHDLSIACPEAARLLLTKTPEQLVLRTETDDTVETLPGYDTDLMQTLFKERACMFDLIRSTDKPAALQLSRCLRIACQREHMSCTMTEPFTAEACLRFLRSCSILTPSWRLLLDQAFNASAGRLPSDALLDHEVRAFAFDFLYRHYLRAVSDGLSLLRVQLTGFSVLAVLTLLCRLQITTQKDRIVIWQKFVKEVEYDSRNTNALEEMLYTEAAFSGAALAHALEQFNQNHTL